MNLEYKESSTSVTLGETNNDLLSWMNELTGRMTRTTDFIAPCHHFCHFRSQLESFYCFLVTQVLMWLMHKQVNISEGRHFPCGKATSPAKLESTLTPKEEVQKEPSSSAVCLPLPFLHNNYCLIFQQFVSVSVSLCTSPDYPES